MAHSAGLTSSVNWALELVSGKIDLNTIDEDVPGGRKLELMYKGTRYLVYHPAYRRKGAPKPRVIVCIHDRFLRWREIWDTCFPAAKHHQLGLIVPFFDPVRFPDFQALNVKGERSDLRLLEILELVGKRAEVEVSEVFLFGVGAGGEFVQRFAIAHPERLARGASFGNSDFVATDPGKIYPRGLKTSPFAPDLDSLNIRNLLKSDLTIAYQEKSGRGVSFSRAMIKYAVKRGITRRIKFMPYRGGYSYNQAWGNVAYPYFKEVFDEN